MKVEELLENAREALQALEGKRVYAEPYRRTASP